MKNLKILVLFAAACFFVSQLAAQGASIGAFKKYDAATGEVVVYSQNAINNFKLGDKVYVMVGGVKVIMKVTFPMISLAKCRLTPEFKSYAYKLPANAPVYRYTETVSESAKYFTGWDDGYLRKTGKVKFINELTEEETKTSDFYFRVVFDAAGHMVKTSEYKKGMVTVSDYYKDERIIKKEMIKSSTNKPYIFYVYDYYDSGYLRQSAEVNLDSGKEMVTKYDEKGNITEKLENPNDARNDAKKR